MVPIPAQVYNVNYKTRVDKNLRNLLSIEVITADPFDFTSISSQHIKIIDDDDQAVAQWDLIPDSTHINIFELINADDNKRYMYFTDDGRSQGTPLTNPTYHYIAYLEDAKGFVVMQTGLIYNGWAIEEEYDISTIMAEISGATSAANSASGYAQSASGFAASANTNSYNAYNIVNNGTYGNSALADLIKQNRDGNTYFEFVYATVADVTRNVEIGDLDNLIIKTKADASADWSSPISTKTVYMWYDTTGASKKLTFRKQDG